MISKLSVITLSLSGILLLQACGRQLPVEESCNFVQNQNLQRVSWDRNLPVDIYFDRSVPQEFTPAIVAAISHWNAIGQKIRGKDFFRLRPNIAGSGTPKKDGHSKIYVMNTWEAEKTTEQARTTVYWSGDQITEADIRINNLNFRYYYSDIPEPAKVHLESLLVHEFGHVLGLAHTNQEPSVMLTSLANGVKRVSPSNSDVESLTCEY